MYEPNEIILCLPLYIFFYMCPVFQLGMSNSNVQTMPLKAKWGWKLALNTSELQENPFNTLWRHMYGFWKLKPGTLQQLSLMFVSLSATA